MYKIVSLFVLVLVYLNLIQAASKYKNERNENGYHFEYYTKGSGRSETGKVKEIGGEHPIVVTGYYRILDTKGNVIKVFYEADENGFRSKTKILMKKPIFLVGLKVVQTLIG